MADFYHRSLNRLAEAVAICSIKSCTLSLCALAFVSLLFASQLQIQHSGDDFFRSTSGAFAAHQRYTEHYTAEQHDVLLIAPFKPDSAVWLNRFGQFHLALEQIGGVAHVLSVLSAGQNSGPDADTFVLPEEGAAATRLISNGGATTLLIVNMDSDVVSDPALVGKAMQSIVHSAKQFQLDVQIAGLPALRLELRRQVQNDVWLFAGIGTLLSLFLIWLTLRQLLTAVLILLAPIIAVFSTLALMTLFGISLNLLTQMLVVLIVVIGASDSLHLAHRLLQMRRMGVTQSVALKRCVVNVVPACLLTSLTTAIGFASLLVSQSVAVQNFGLTGLIGSVVVVVVVVSSLPLLAASCYQSSLPQTRNEASSQELQMRCTNYVRRIINMRVFVIASAIFLAAIMLVVSLHNEPSYEVGENLPSNSAYTQTVAALQKDFNGGYMLVVMLEPTAGKAKRGVLLQQVDLVQQQLGASFEKPWTSIRDLIKAAPGGGVNSRLRVLPTYLQNRFWDPKNTGSAILTYTLDSHEKHELDAAVARTRAVLDHGLASSQWHYSITGFVAIASAASELILTELLKSLLLAMALMVALCWVLFRQINWAFMVLLPTAFPILAIAFILAMQGEPIRYMYALLFSVCFGLSVDSAIHILIAYKDSRAKLANPIKAMGQALSVTFLPLLLATVVVSIGFAVLMLSASPTLSMVGMLGAISTVCAFASALILIPSLLES